MITFGISTKNRLSDLEVTLARLCIAGLNKFPIIVVDDGSSPPLPKSLLRDFPLATMIRHEKSAGYVVRRHEIAMATNTPYYFSLDDDSSVCSGDIDALIGFLDGLENWISVGFPIVLPDGSNQVESMHRQPYVCRTFVGCAHVLNLSAYKKIGGYALGIEHQGEEVDLATRGFLYGYDTWHYPELVVKHEVTIVSRNYARMAYYGARNKTIFIRNYYPASRRMIKLFASGLERIVYFAKDRQFGHLLGTLDGLRLDLSNWSMRLTPVRNFREWECLPLY